MSENDGAGLTRRSALALGLAAAGGAALARPAIAQRANAPGITDTEILIGSTQPFSGPASSYSQMGRTGAAYVNMLNEQGGINGRKIKLIQLDDGYSPPKTIEQTRRLVEQEKVAFLFSQLGTPTGMSTRKYLNDKKVPNMFISSGASQFFDYEHFPWIVGWQPSYLFEGRVYARYILTAKPDAKIAILHQNDDSGRDLMTGMKQGLGDKAAQIVSVTSYEVTDPTTDSQVLSARQSGADVFFFAGIPKFSAMTIRKVYDIGWKPMFILSNPASPVATALVPAGVEKAVGLITTAYLKDPTDPQWENDAGYKEWRAFLAKYYPEGDVKDFYVVYGYAQAQCLEQVLKNCGSDLSRENIREQMWHLDYTSPMFQPGVSFTIKPGDTSGFKKLRLVRFDGKTWLPFGDAIGA